jgi:hypothetical protein
MYAYKVAGRTERERERKKHAFLSEEIPGRTQFIILKKISVFEIFDNISSALAG